MQFEADILKTSFPISLEAIEKYLASGFIKDIGPIYVKKLIEVFSKDVLVVIANNDVRLRQVASIGSIRAKRIKES